MLLPRKVLEISIAKLESIEPVNQLIEQFSGYDKIFKLVFLRYNGKNEDITLHYRLRTYKNFMNKEEFIENLLIQYLKNPIQIPSELYYVEIYDQESTNNLGFEPKYFEFIDNFFIINISNLYNLESEYIDIIITSKFKLNINSIISFHISNQPKIIEGNQERFELTAILKTNLFPERFQCFNINLNFDLILNNIICYFIPRNFVLAARKWYNMEVHKKGKLRKKNFYYKLIRNKFGITPLQFNDKIHSIFLDISAYFQENFKNIIKIENKRGVFIPKSPKSIKFIDKPGLALIKLKFETTFDNKNYISHAFMTLDISWMKKIFDKYF